MKRSLIYMLAYVLLLHVILPGIYYCFYDIFPLYSSIIEEQAFWKSFWIILLSLSSAILVLALVPKSPNDVIKPHIKGSVIAELFYSSTLFKLFSFLFMGGYQSLITGGSNGTLSRYISLFLDPFFLLLVLLFTQQKKTNVIFAIFFYIASVTLSGSRSGVLAVIFIFLIGFTFHNFSIYRSKISKFLLIGLGISPLLFVYATLLRESSFSEFKLLGDIIVGRMSTLETAMWPVHYTDQGLDASLFDEKYSVLNQFKLILDSLIPGQIFEADVMPNNYYRAIFLDYGIDFVKENYMSINITLPIYLYVKYNYFCVLFSILHVLIFYKLLKLLKSYPLFILACLASFYNLIYYFDYVMLFTQFYSFVLTIISIKIYVYLRRELFKLNITTKENYEPQN